MAPAAHGPPEIQRRSAGDQKCLPFTPPARAALAVPRPHMTAMDPLVSDPRRRARAPGLRTDAANLAAYQLDIAAERGQKTAEGIALGVKITHAELADLAGATREAVRATLLEFRWRGLLAIDPAHRPGGSTRTRGRRARGGSVIRRFSRRSYDLSYRTGILPTSTDPMVRQVVLTGALPRGSALVLAEIPDVEPAPWGLVRACRVGSRDRVAPLSAPDGELMPNVAALMPHPGGEPTRPGSAAARPGSVNRSMRTDRTRPGCPQDADRRVPKNSLARHATRVAFPDPSAAHRETPRRSAADPTRCARAGAPTDQVPCPLTAAARRPASPCPPLPETPCTATS